MGERKRGGGECVARDRWGECGAKERERGWCGAKKREVVIMGRKRVRGGKYGEKGVSVG